jgi:hypothetical protein
MVAHAHAVSGTERMSKTAWFGVYPVLCLVWLGTTGLSIASSNSVTAPNIHLSAAQVRLIGLVFSLPLLLIWVVILFAGLSMLRYSRAINGARESSGFRFVAYSVFVLLAGQMVGSYLGGLQQLASRNAADPQHTKLIFVIIINYASVMFALATYGLLLRGSQLLLNSIGERLGTVKKLKPALLACAALAAVYMWLIYANPARQVSVDTGVTPIFGLPYWLIVLTVALPCVVAWAMGIVALMGIYRYRLKTTGIVYKLLFKKLVVGMTLFISTTISLQLFAQLYTLYADSTASVILGIIALIYLLLAYSFVLVAQGARKLNTIETLLIE